MSNIQEDMKELNAIVHELKSLTAKTKEFRSRKKELESRILKYLEDNEAPGLKFQELIVMKAESVTHSRLKKKEKQDNMMKVLENHGVQDIEKVIEELKRSSLGDEKTASKLKVKISVPELF